MKYLDPVTVQWLHQSLFVRCIRNKIVSVSKLFKKTDFDLAFYHILKKLAIGSNIRPWSNCRKCHQLFKNWKKKTRIEIEKTQTKLKRGTYCVGSTSPRRIGISQIARIHVVLFKSSQCKWSKIVFFIPLKILFCSNRESWSVFPSLIIISVWFK